jgi:hypothetical protein
MTRGIWLAVLIGCTAEELPPGNTEFDTSTSDWVADGSCSASLFRQYAASPANGAYDDPYVAANCEEAGTVTVQSNGIPHFEFVELTPNPLASQDHTWQIPLSPALTGTQQEVPLLGTIAVTLTGLPIFGPNEGEMPDPFGDPIFNAIVDACLGHTAQGGLYHPHGLVESCVIDDVDAAGPSPLLGFALDGFPIYGPRGCLDAACSEVVTFESSWEQTGDPTTYAWDNNTFVEDDAPTKLDRCNGRVGPDGSYRYHATATFPYVLGCYSGTPTAAAPGGPGGGGPGGGPP